MPDDEREGTDNGKQEQTVPVERRPVERRDEKNGSSLVSTVVIVAIVVGAIIWFRASPGPPPSNQPPAAPPVSPKPESTKPAVARIENADSDDPARHTGIDKAVVELITSKYKGWLLRGKSQKDDAPNDVLYDLDLVARSQEKIVPVIVEKFQKENEETEYWVAVEPSRADLIDLRIDDLKRRIDDLGKNDAGKDGDDGSD